MLVTLIIFIIVLGVLVFVHELGHFVAAKKSGMQVDEFGFGFPPRLFGIQKKQGKWGLVYGPKTAEGEDTVYSINLIPLGGFVKILGENNDQAGNPKAFTSKPFGPRLVTLLSGVIMNVLLAWVVISLGLVIGTPAAYSDDQEFPFGGKINNVAVTVVELAPESPAKEAGIKVGDGIISVSGNKIESVAELQEQVAGSEGQALRFEINRAGSVVETEVSPKFNENSGKFQTGIVISLVGKLKYPWYMAPLAGAVNTWNSLKSIFLGLGGLFTGEVGFNQLGGPAKIAQLTGEASKLGLPYLLQFTAFLSLNLAILNTLPFPALDGGRVLFLLIEKLRRKPNNQQVEQVFNAVGFLLLLLLMLAVTVNDVRSFGGIGEILGRIF